MLIAFSGKMTAGKTVSADYLVQNYNFVKLRFADPIYRIADMLMKVYTNKYTYNEFCTDLNEICRELLSSEEQIEKALSNLGIDLYHEYSEVGSTIKFKDSNYRDLLQKIGTEKMRTVDPDVWIKYMINTIASLPLGTNVVIDDLRFIDEYLALEELGFVIIRLDIDPEVQKERVLKYYGEYNLRNVLHRSEIELDNEIFHHRINANVHMSEMFTSIEEVLKL